MTNKHLTDDDLHAILAALKAAHYECVCLEPRLSGRFQNSVRVVKEQCADAIKRMEARALPHGVQS